jgi:hypothetical protein
MTYELSTDRSIFRFSKHALSVELTHVTHQYSGNMHRKVKRGDQRQGTSETEQ